jgi:hypothetical protein
MSAPVFISYSSKDQDIAKTICRALEVRGLKCWISGRDVAAGENFQEAIVRALRRARRMLLVFTGNANNSDEIKKEVAVAGRHRVTVVPVRSGLRTWSRATPSRTNSPPGNGSTCSRTGSRRSSAHFAADKGTGNRTDGKRGCNLNSPSSKKLWRAAGNERSG